LLIFATGWAVCGRPQPGHESMPLLSTGLTVVTAICNKTTKENLQYLMAGMLIKIMSII